MQEQRRQEGSADVDPRPARDPVGGVKDALRAIDAPRSLGRSRPCCGFVDPIALGIGRGEPCETGTGPRVERNAERSSEYTGAERTNDLNVGGGEAFRDRK